MTGLIGERRFDQWKFRGLVLCGGSMLVLVIEGWRWQLVGCVR